MSELPTLAVRDDMYALIAQVGQALSNPTRLHLLSLLSQGDKDVETLAERAGQSVASVSAHLKVLRGASLVASTRVGRRVRYRLAGPHVEELNRTLRQVAVAAQPGLRELIQRYFTEPDSLTPVDAAALLERAGAGEVVVVDLRPIDEYETGHLPGARSIPFPELAARLGELPRDKRIVAYCRGAHCVMSVRGTALLREHGRDAVRLRGSVNDWRRAGLPLNPQPAEEVD